MTQTQKKSLPVLVLAFLVSAAPARAETIRIAAALAPYQNILMKIKEPFEKSTGIKLEVSEDPAPHTMVKLMDGKADVAFNSLSQRLLEEGIQKEKPEIRKFPAYIRSLVGSDRVRLLIHSGIGVKELTQDQVVAVTGGSAKNWKEVGGADLPIKYVKIKASTGAFWETEVLKGKKIRSVDIHVNQISEVAEKIGATPGAFGIIPDGTKAAAGTYKPVIPLYGRPVAAYTLVTPSTGLRKLYEFIKGEGQKYIKAD